MNDETLIDGPDPGTSGGPPRPPASAPPAKPSEGAAALPPSRKQDLSGATLGGCRLERKIAEGGMGQVYAAVQTNLDRKVAVKVLSERLASHPEFLLRFEREAKAAAALNHPNLVQVYDFGATDGRHFMVMELIEGSDLADHVQRQGRLSVTEGLAVIEQAAQALKAALAKSIIHRDIKPSNLLRTADGRVKVSDLGLAKILTEDSDVTATGMSMGSPHFLAPEQADDASRVDHRADIYSLGITLFFLLTGKRPYANASPFSVVLAHANKPLPTGQELGTELPPEIEAFIHKLAAKRPEDRCQDYDALLADLERVRSGLAPVAPKHQAGAEWNWRSLSPLRLGLAAVLVAATMIVFLWPVLKREPRPETSVVVSQGQNARDERSQGPRGRGGPDGPSREFGGPDDRPPGPGKGFDPPPGMGNQRFPLPRLFPRPNRAPLKDGPVEQMLAEADAFAKANTNQPVRMIDSYRQIAQKSPDTKAGREAWAKHNSWIELHQALVQKTMEEYKKKSQALIQASNPQAAYELWKKFPAELRIKEVDWEIQEVLEQIMPANFNPRE